MFLACQHQLAGIFVLGGGKDSWIGYMHTAGKIMKKFLLGMQIPALAGIFVFETLRIAKHVHMYCIGYSENICFDDGNTKLAGIF